MKTQLLAIFSMAMLVFPAVTLYYVDAYQIDTIQLEIESAGLQTLQTGDYYNTNPDANVISSSDNNNLQWSTGSILSKLWIDMHGDTYHHRTLGYKWEKKENITIVDNVNFVDQYDYDASGGVTGDYVFYWLNLTNHYMANNIDALIINWTASHGEWGLHFIWGTGSGTTTNTQMDEKSYIGNNTYVFTFTPSFKNQLLANQDNRVWLYATGLNLTDLSYSFSVERADTSGLFSISPMILTQIIFLFILTVSGIFTLFATDTIDLKIDRRSW